jgi:hypothetical protein
MVPSPKYVLTGAAIIVFLTLIRALIVGLIRAAAARPARRDPTTGDLILRHNNVVTWMAGIFAIGLLLLLAVMTFVKPPTTDAQVLGVIGPGACLLLFFGWGCLYGLRRRTRIGERGLTSEYLFAKPKFLPWEDVVKVSMRGHEFWVHRSDGRRALLHARFIGVKGAVPLLEKYLSDAVKQKYKRTLARFAASPPFAAFTRLRREREVWRKVPMREVPTALTKAGIVWIIAGALILLAPVVQLLFGTSMLFGAPILVLFGISVLFGAPFIFIGVRSVRSTATARGILENSVGSIFFGLLALGAGALLAAYGEAILGAIALLAGIALLTACVLALVGRRGIG